MASIGVKRRSRRSRSLSARNDKGGWGSFFVILGIAFLIRTLFFQPFTIPSGSMQPGLVEGDYILVSKFATGYGRHSSWPIPFPVRDDRLFRRGPERGDVIVFRPEGVRRDYIKRVVGVPGDRVRLEADVPVINDVPLEVKTLPGSTPVKRSSGGYTDAQVRAEATPDGKAYLTAQVNLGSAESLPEVVLGEDEYFVLGDNRDASSDSRVSETVGGAGVVRSPNIVGEAKLVVLSVEDEFSLIKPWTWAKVRGDRWFKAIR